MRDEFIPSAANAVDNRLAGAKSAGQTIKMAAIKAVIDALTPAVEGDADREVWRSFLKSQGGPLVFARQLVGEESVRCLRAHLKERAYDPDGGRVSFLDIVFGRVQEAAKVAQAPLESYATSYGQKAVDTFHAAVENKYSRKEYTTETGAMAPDWDAISEMSRRLNDRRLSQDSTLYRVGMGKVPHGHGVLRRWLPNYQFGVVSPAGEVIAKMAVSKLIRPALIEDRQTVREFKDRWYNHPERLDLLQIQMADQTMRYAGAMVVGQDTVAAVSAKNNFMAQAMKMEGASMVLLAPVSQKGQKTIENRLNPKAPAVRYRRKVYGKGRSWFTCRKVGDQVLMVEEWATKDVGDGVLVARCDSIEMGPYEWASFRKILLKTGFVQSEV